MKATETHKLTLWLKETIKIGMPKGEVVALRKLAVGRLKRKGMSYNHAHVVLCRAWEAAQLPPIAKWHMASLEFSISIEERKPHINAVVEGAMIELGEEFEQLIMSEG